MNVFRVHVSFLVVLLARAVGATDTTPERTVANAVADILDPFGIVASQRAASDANVLLDTERLYNRWSESAPAELLDTTTRVYISQLHHACDECTTLLFFHGGFLVEGDRFTVPSGLMGVAIAAGWNLLSVGYPTNSRDLGVIRGAVDAAVAWTAARLPLARIVLSGASAGGTLALDRAHRNATHIAGVLVDSPIVCFDSIAADALADESNCMYGKDLSGRTVFDIGRGMCFNNLSVAVPVFVVHPEQDPIVPAAQYARLTGAQLTLCESRRGRHTNSWSLFSLDCHGSVAEWVRSEFGATFDEARFYTHLLVAAPPDALQNLMTVVRDKQVLCRNVCRASTTDAEYRSLICD